MTCTETPTRSHSATRSRHDQVAPDDHVAQCDHVAWCDPTMKPTYTRNPYMGGTDRNELMVQAVEKTTHRNARGRN